MHVCVSMHVVVGIHSKKKAVGIVGTRFFGLWIVVSMVLHTLVMATWNAPLREPVSDAAKASFVVTFASLPVGPVGKIAPVANHDVAQPTEPAEDFAEKQSMSTPGTAETTDESRTMIRTSSGGRSTVASETNAQNRELEAALAEYDRDQAELDRELAANANGLTMVKTTMPNADQVRTRLVADLDKAFQPYPLLARQHGWQGLVVLALTVEKDGRITNIRITRSSGNSVLDGHAVESLRKVQQLQLAKGWRLPDSLPLELPVKYVLPNI